MFKKCSNVFRAYSRPSANYNEPEKVEEPSELEEIAEALKAPIQELPAKKTPRSANKRKAEPKEEAKTKKQERGALNLSADSRQSKDVAASSPLKKVPVAS